MMADWRFTHLPNDQAGCGWYELLSLPPPAKPVKHNVIADYVVLGAGLTGLAAARRLGELLPNSRIALVDAQRVGEGASGRNSGFLIDLPHNLNSESYTGNLDEDRKLIRRNRTAISILRNLVQTHDIQCDWSEQGKLHAAASERGARALRAFAAGLNGLSEQYTNLTAEDITRITGSTYYHSGIHTPGSVLVQPAALVRGLARSMPPNVVLYENSPVADLELGSTIRLRCPEGEIRASALILANNSFAGQFGLLKGRIIPVSTYASMTRPLDPAEQERLDGEKTWGLIPADPLGTTARRLPNQRLLIRNTFTYNSNFKASSPQHGRIRAQHRRSFEARFPSLAGMEFEYTWGGVLGISRNSKPCFGRLAPSVFAAVGQNGLGLAQGTIAGKLIAEYACDLDNDLLRDMVSGAMPARNPPAPFLGLGVTGNIRWKEWRAGKEV